MKISERDEMKIYFICKLFGSLPSKTRAQILERIQVRLDERVKAKRKEGS